MSDLNSVLPLIKDGTVLVAVLTAAYRVIRASDRITGMLKNFPPHLHVNGHILYPPDYEPPTMSNLADPKR